MKEELMNNLLNFIKKATSDSATNEEIRALPEVARVLKELIQFP